MSLTSIRELVKDDLKAVDHLISEQLNVNLPFINELGQYIMNSGGKRIRPLLVILGARAAQYQGQVHISLAAAMEFFHAATLLHDDVIDASNLRRGKTTANTVWSNKASVLVGDFLFTRSFQIMLHANNVSVLEVLANASNTITNGEVLQLLNCKDPETSEANYMKVIQHKTAALFAAATQLGAMLAQKSQTEITAYQAYGMHVGTAFQLIDDALDYCADSQTIGKNIGDDLRDGKTTLPLIQAYKQGNQEQQQLIRLALEQGSLDYLDQIIETINDSKAIDYTYKIARSEIDKALSALSQIPTSKYTKALEQLAQFAIDRES